jgi:hypothetical protein
MNTESIVESSPKSTRRQGYAVAARSRRWNIDAGKTFAVLKDAREYAQKITKLAGNAGDLEFVYECRTFVNKSPPYLTPKARLIWRPC